MQRGSGSIDASGRACRRHYRPAPAPAELAAPAEAPYCPAIASWYKVRAGSVGERNAWALVEQSGRGERSPASRASRHGLPGWPADPERAVNGPKYREVP